MINVLDMTEDEAITCAEGSNVEINSLADFIESCKRIIMRLLKFGHEQTFIELTL